MLLEKEILLLNTNKFAYMKSNNVLSRFIVLIKNIVFKHFLSKILFFATVIFFLSSFNSQYKTPLWITFLTEEDGTMHTCHRSDYLEMMEFMEWNNETIELHEIDKHYKSLDYWMWERVEKKVNFRKNWYAHPNYVESLDKYCVN
jgi:hypothetical protein